MMRAQGENESMETLAAHSAGQGVHLEYGVTGHDGFL